MGINEREFMTHYGQLFERRDNSFIGRIIQFLAFHPRKRVSLLRSHRFVACFRYVGLKHGLLTMIGRRSTVTENVYDSLHRTCRVPCLLL